MKDYKQILIMEPYHVEYRDDPLVQMAETSGYGKLKDMSVPLEPDEVAGNTIYSVVSVGTEMGFYRGYYRAKGIPIGMKYPKYCGYAAVFEVRRVGAAVTDLKPGDLCFCKGPHATIQRNRRRDVIKVPEGMDPIKVPFARFMNVTMSTLTDCLAKPPAKIMVSGLGIIGVMGALAFQRCGYEVIAVDPIESRCECARECGVKTVFTQAPLDDPKYAGKISLVVECSSVEPAVLTGAKMLRRGGEVVLVGTQIAPTGDYQMHELLHTLFRGNISVKGGSEWRIPLHEPDFENTTVNKEENAAPYSFQNSCYMNMEAAINWLNEGLINIDPLYEVFDPRNATEIYENIDKRVYPKPAILFDWRDIK